MVSFKNGSRARAGFRMFAAGVVIAGLCALCGATVATAQTLVQNRITAPVRAAQVQPLPGTVAPLTSLARDQGQLGGSTVIHGMSIVFRRSAAQQADLNSLLQQQQTPGSPLYHQWLTPEQFAARYGVSQADLAKVAAWLRSQGFTIDAIPPSADEILFSGTAAQVNAAFQTELHRYLLDGQPNWANATPVSLPQAIAGIALRVGHLNTFRPRPNTVKRPVSLTRNLATGSASPQYTVQTQNGPVNLLAPADIQTIYDLGGLYNGNITGAGQTMAIVGQTDIEQYKSDIQNFRSLSGLNAGNMPTQVVVPGTGVATVSPSDLQEADLDVEWSGAVAKDATILYVTVGGDGNHNVIDSLQYAIQNNLVNNNSQVVPVISISYGSCEQESGTPAQIQQIEDLLQRANSQGQTVVAASGDDGSAQCDDSDNTSNGAVPASHGLSVNYPASSAYVTAAGGTSFNGDLGDPSAYWSQANTPNNGSALRYIPEVPWNNTPDLTSLQSVGRLSAAGGGVSTLFSKPSWQVAPGVPADGKRDLPDISLAADPMHDGYVLCTEETNSAGTALSGGPTCAYPVGSGAPYFNAKGQGYLYGGTSIAAPQLAAMITLWNQKAGNASGVGNVNPILYLAARNTPGAFHDVTSGSIAVVCQQGTSGCVSNGAGGYIMSCCSAGPGYDLATGLGTPDAAAIAALWPSIAPSPNFSLVPGPATLSVQPGGSATTTLAITSVNGFAGAVTLACSNLPANTTCSFSPGASVNLAAGAAQNVTLTLATTTAASREAPSQPFHRNWPMQAAFAGVFGLSLFGLGRKKKRLFPRGWMTVLLLAAGLAAAGAMTACGGGSAAGTSPSPTSPPTNPTSTTTTVTVTGTSGASNASARIQLTIT